MSSLWTTILIVYYAIVAVALGSVLLRRKEPVSLIAWVLAIFFIPVAGLAAYWLFGSARIVRHARKHRKRLAKRVHRPDARVRVQTASPQQQSGSGLEPPFDEIERLGRRLAGYPAIAGNAVTVFNSNQETYDALIEMMRAAQHHIHLEYYIWENDQTGKRFRDLVIEQARRGVECRVLLDAAGSWLLPRSFLKPWREAGVAVSFFHRPGLFKRRPTINYRNHRKIAIVDGAVALIGSHNIGDEYLGLTPELPVWIDTNIRIDGPAALFLQEIFAEDWFVATREELYGDAYFPEANPAGGRASIQLLPSGPDQTISALEQIFFAAVANARKSIRIVTPYFVPDRALRMALRHASFRGVEVELIVSMKTDMPAIIWASRSFYAEMLEVGVRIFEYEEGMLHSKVVSIDDTWCMIGSANMDVRSFRLNFELTALIYDGGLAEKISEWCAARRKESRGISKQVAEGRPLRQQLLQGAARLLSPLL